MYIVMVLWYYGPWPAGGDRDTHTPTPIENKQPSPGSQCVFVQSEKGFLLKWSKPERGESLKLGLLKSLGALVNEVRLKVTQVQC